ncbi:MAG: histidine phosphatase family protein [Catenulispora sp.]|nr:histidine phosphatase family protein [Catenulispora sp.]
MSELILLRHGQTEWSRDGRHTGRTDLPLTDVGEDQARAAAKLLAGTTFAAVYTSPLTRAVRTAELAGLTHPTQDPDLLEWDYGGYEGITSDEIHQTRPGWYLWDDGVIPGDAEHPGETVEQVGARVDRVLARVRPVLADGEGSDVCLVAHGHVLRILCARWLGLAPDGGRFFRLDTATVSRLGFEHGRPVVDGLNQRG